MVSAFTHVSVLNLPRSRERRAAVSALLTHRLGLRHGPDYSFVARPADCRAYGNWSDADSPLPAMPNALPSLPSRISSTATVSDSAGETDGATSPQQADTANSSWWLHRRTCRREVYIEKTSLVPHTSVSVPSLPFPASHPQPAYSPPTRKELSRGET